MSQQPKTSTDVEQLLCTSRTSGGKCYFQNLLICQLLKTLLCIVHWFGSKAPHPTALCQQRGSPSLIQACLWSFISKLNLHSTKQIPFESQLDDSHLIYSLDLTQGAIFILRKDIGVGLENGNFPLLYVVKMFLRRWVGGSETPQITLT